jgi:hypothetical protein
MKFFKILFLGLLTILLSSCPSTDITDCLNKNTELEKTNQALTNANNNLSTLNVKLVRVNDSTILVLNELNNKYILLQGKNSDLTYTINNLNSRVLELLNENDSLNSEINSLSLMFSDCQSYIVFLESTLSDSTRYNIIDSIVYIRDTLPTLYLDTVPVLYLRTEPILYLDTIPTLYLDTTLVITDTILVPYYDSVIQCYIIYQATCNKDSIYSSFYKIPEEFFPTFRLRAANSWFQYGKDIMFEGWNKIKNYSKIPMPDSSAYLEMTVYDSTFNNVLYHNKYDIPAIDSSETLKLNWNSGSWVFPYDGFYYMGQFIYENRSKYNQPDRIIDGNHYRFATYKPVTIIDTISKINFCYDNGQNQTGWLSIYDGGISPDSVKISNRIYFINKPKLSSGTNGETSTVVPYNVGFSYQYLPNSSSSNTVTYEIHGLNKNNIYNFYWFCSRKTESGVVAGRITYFSIGDKTVSIDAVGNKTKYIYIESVKPDSNGTIKYTMKNTAGQYGYQNALIITQTRYKTFY